MSFMLYVSMEKSIHLFKMEILSDLLYQQTYTIVCGRNIQKTS